MLKKTNRMPNYSLLIVLRQISHDLEMSHQIGAGLIVLDERLNGNFHRMSKGFQKPTAGELLPALDLRNVALTRANHLGELLLGKVLCFP